MASESAVFACLAGVVTPFVCNLDELNVNVGAARDAPEGAAWEEPRVKRLKARSPIGGLTGAHATSREPADASTLSSALPPATGDANTHTYHIPPRLPSCTGFGWRERRAEFKRLMTSGNRCEHFCASQNVAAAERRVQQRLLAARLEPVRLRGRAGGDSLFEAVSVALWGTEAYSPQLRQLAVEHVRSHADTYAPFLGDDLPAYLRGMARPGVPGDELMLRALCDHFGVPGNVVTADAFMWCLRYPPAQTRTTRELFLGFVGPASFMPVRQGPVLSAAQRSAAPGSGLV